MQYKTIDSTKNATRHDDILLCLLSDREPARGSEVARMLKTLERDFKALERDGFSGGRWSEPWHAGQIVKPWANRE